VSPKEAENLGVPNARNATPADAGMVRIFVAPTGADETPSSVVLNWIAVSRNETGTYLGITGVAALLLQGGAPAAHRVHRSRVRAPPIAPDGSAQPLLNSTQELGDDGATERQM